MIFIGDLPQFSRRSLLHLASIHPSPAELRGKVGAQALQVLHLLEMSCLRGCHGSYFPYRAGRFTNIIWLVVDLPLWKIWVRQFQPPLKNMSSSVGVMKFPTEWKVMKNSMVPVTTKQLSNICPCPIHQPVCKYTSSMDGLVAGMGKTMEQQIWNPWKPRILTAVNPSIPASMSGTSTNILWMVAKSESPVDRCFIPLISHYL